MNERTPLFLMANLGSEVSKILFAKEKKDTVTFDLAVAKAKSIFSELKSIPETKNNEEINILNTIIDDLQKENPIYKISPQNLKSYFIPFALRLMKN